MSAMIFPGSAPRPYRRRALSMAARGLSLTSTYRGPRRPSFFIRIRGARSGLAGSSSQ
jgi:hypothetical protein